MASHRMPESERPRRAVPAWVTAPPEDARPVVAAPTAASAGVAPAVGSVEVSGRPVARALPAVGTAHAVGTVPAVGLEAHLAPAAPALDPNAVAPDYPPAQELLPPAPTSPNVDTIPFAPVSSAPVVSAPTVVSASTVNAPGSGVTVTTVPAGSSAVGRHGAGQPGGSQHGGSQHGAAQHAATGRRGAGAGAGAGGMAMPVAPGTSEHAAEVHRPPLGPVDAATPGAPANWYTPQSGAPAAADAAAPATPEAPVPSGSWLPTVGAPAPGGSDTAWSASGPALPPTPAVPVVPAAGQPRFSVPGLEHVVVEGGEPEPVGPIGYRTPARFARQQARVVPPAATAATAATAAPTFDAIIGASAPTGVAQSARLDPAVSTPSVPPLAPVLPPVTPAVSGSADTTAVDPAAVAGPTPAREHRNARGRGTTGRRLFGSRRTVEEPPKRRSTAVPLPAPAEVPTVATAVTEGEARLPAGAQPTPGRTARPARSLGPTQGAVLGAIAGLGTIGLAAWWFTAPATVHAVGVVLGLLAVLVSVVTMRNPLTTWQRSVALLGAVLGTVGTLVLLWAVASALGAPLPDITGTGTVPTIAP